MALKIDTFSNSGGGNTFYKAAVHPLAAKAARNLVVHMQQNGPVAIYDPNNQLNTFTEFFPLNDVEIAGIYVQDVDQIGRVYRNHAAQPVTQIGQTPYKSILVASFDSKRLVDQIKHLFPANTPWVSFDELRMPDDLLSDKFRYLAATNFANNFAFFRDGQGHHTRVVSANYWAGYGGKAEAVWCTLLDANGETLATWKDQLPVPDAPLVIDSKDVRARFNLPEFTGQLFMHIVGAAGHDVLKYALDTYGDDGKTLSCTHDANAWPSDTYAGLPAPADGEDVVFWVQNSHPSSIKPGEIGLNLMGSDKIVYLQKEIPAYGTYRLSVAELLPQAKWPQQIEIQAGKHLVRPRYEVFQKNGHQRISHPNVQRNDLKGDKRLAELGDLLGKLHILPAPILPLERYTTLALPTPMSTAQQRLPLKALVYDATGKQVAEHKFGNLKRSDSVALNVNDLLKGKKLAGGFGHLELIYDFAVASDGVDGWMHSLFRYVDRESGHEAETSFGAHIFNTLLTYKNEPQSYAGKPPGLTTRLFLRVAPQPYDAFCHLVFPASMPWHATSDTALILMSQQGKEIARKQVKIPCSGSLLWKVSAMFTADERAAAGEHCYVTIRDTTCRLFGYHGLITGTQEAFSLDHMFGF